MRDAAVRDAAVRAGVAGILNARPDIINNPITRKRSPYPTRHHQLVFFVHMGRHLLLSVWESDDIRDYSAVEILKHTLNIEDRQNSLIDPRLGPLGPCEICPTCHCTLDTCTGHFAFIDLGVPCYHPFFINEAYATIRKCCFHCGALVTGSPRFCPQCDHRMGRWVRKARSRSAAYIKDHIVYKTETSELKLTTEKAYTILQRHGKGNLMVKHMPVIPPCARPTITINQTRAAFHELTKLYAAVAKEASLMRVFKKQLQTRHILRNQWSLLQDAVYHVYDTSKNPKSDGGLRQRVDGKQGRFRQNLLGKRVDYSARTVITADANLDLDQIGVPVSIAKRLTKPHHVTSFNMEESRAMIRRGPHELGGALYVTRRSDGSRWDLEFVPSSLAELAFRIKVGDVIERMIRDDDIVLMNRQPSLHKLSMMGHRVKILPYSTFRLNLSATPPYNAVSSI